MLYCLNLPPHLRLRTENMFITGITPPPQTQQIFGYRKHNTYLSPALYHVFSLMTLHNSSRFLRLHLRKLLEVRENKTPIKVSHEGKIANKRKVNSHVNVAKSICYLLKGDKGYVFME